MARGVLYSLITLQGVVQITLPEFHDKKKKFFKNTKSENKLMQCLKNKSHIEW